MSALHAPVTANQPTVTTVGLPRYPPVGLPANQPGRPCGFGWKCPCVPRDPLAPIAKAVDELAAAKANIDEAQDHARTLVTDARRRERTARATLHDRIVEAAQAGVRQVDIVRASGMTREAIRRILRNGGVEPD